MKGKRTISVTTLTAFSTAVFEKAGLASDHAVIMAGSMILADLRGVKSHGIVRIATYIERMEKGVVDPRAAMTYERHTGAAALLDAKNGFGQVAGTIAMAEAIRIARMYGIGMVGVKNSNHFGIASYYSMMALEQGTIGIVMTNASPAIAPFGTTVPLFGTNPLSVAVPAGKEKPIVLDMSMSVVARGKIRYADLIGDPIPQGWALDAQGNPTLDAAQALKGSLVPIGGAKGSGLSFVVDILCGLLTGSSLTGSVKNVTDMSGPALTGHVFIAIDIDHFIEPEAFTKSMEAVIGGIRGMKPKSGNKVYMAGEIESELEEKKRAAGLELDEDVVKSLNSLAARYGLAAL